ncbi:MAG: hypothetical protein K0U98_24850 [Deltaproteobacteria bacterium]|nr:hypothetical protein [Deltaproteobacteria bacterium]
MLYSRTAGTNHATEYSPAHWDYPNCPTTQNGSSQEERDFLSPQRRRESGLLLMVVGFADTNAEALAESVRDLGFTVLSTTSEPEHGIIRLQVRTTDRAQAEEIASLPEVRWIEEVGELTLRNGTTTWVNQTNVTNSRTVWTKGLRGEGQIIGHIDGPIDINHCFFRDDTDNTVRPDHRKVVGLRNIRGTGLNDHGSFSAANAMGEDVDNDADATTPNANNGNAPRSRVTHGNVYDLNWLGGSVNLLRFFSTPSGLFPYLQLGPGLYRSKSGSTDGGFNVGFGVGRW